VSANELHRKSAVFAVEATSQEMHGLWLEWSEDALIHGFGSPKSRRVPWEQISLGYGHEIGKFHGHPVFVAISFNVVAGRLIAFYEATSRVVEHDMVRKWTETEFPASRGHTNATNFSHAVYL